MLNFHFAVISDPGEVWVSDQKESLDFPESLRDPQKKNPKFEILGPTGTDKRSNLSVKLKMAAAKMAAIHGVLWEVPFLWEMGIGNPHMDT